MPAAKLPTATSIPESAIFSAALDDDDRDFRERFDTLATYFALAIVALASTTWIGLTIRRLYH